MRTSCSPTSSALDPNEHNPFLLALPPSKETAIAARWIEWIPWVCLDLRRRGRDGSMSSPEFMRLRQRHFEHILDLMRIGISMRTIRRHRLDDPRITDEVRAVLVAAAKERQPGVSFSSHEDGSYSVAMVCDPLAVPAAIRSIRDQVCEHFYMREMRDPELTVRTNRRSYVLPRQIAMYIAKQLTGATLQEIGREFGGRHHTTVLHSINKIEEMRRSDKALDRTIRRLIYACAKPCA